MQKRRKDERKSHSQLLLVVTTIEQNEKTLLFPIALFAMKKPNYQRNSGLTKFECFIHTTFYVHSYISSKMLTNLYSVIFLIEISLM